MRSIRQRLKKFYSSRNITWLVRRWLWILIHYDKRNDCLRVTFCVCVCVEKYLWSFLQIIPRERERKAMQRKRKNRLRFQRRFSFFVMLSTHLSLLRKYSSLFLPMKIFINADWSSLCQCQMHGERDGESERKIREVNQPCRRLYYKLDDEKMNI